MDLNFCLREMTHLRYFAPVVLEGNKSGLKSTFYVARSHKYNCPFIEPNSQELKQFVESHRVNVRPLKELKSVSNNIITSEKSCLEQIKECSVDKKVSMTYQTDFTVNYEKFEYNKHYDMIMMPSENIANFYNFTGDKNVYLGITKYDINLNKEDILAKYNITQNTSKVLFVWPKTRDLHKMPIDIIKNFNELGWQVLVKTRGKDPMSRSTINYLLDNGNRVFIDNSWHPHTTQELLEISDLVVNSGSTTIEECVMHETPVLNFDIKPAKRHGRTQKHRVTHSYLYDYDFCISLSSLTEDFNNTQLDDWIKQLQVSKEFKKCKKEWLFDHKNTCKSLIGMIL